MSAGSKQGKVRRGKARPDKVVSFGSDGTLCFARLWLCFAAGSTPRLLGRHWQAVRSAWSGLSNSRYPASLH